MSTDDYYAEEDGEWEMEKLLAKRKNKETKETEYKVLWAGCTEGEEGATSWELKSWLEEEGYDNLVLLYEKEAKAAAAEKQRKSEEKPATPPPPAPTAPPPPPAPAPQVDEPLKAAVKELRNAAPKKSEAVAESDEGEKGNTSHRYQKGRGQREGGLENVVTCMESAFLRGTYIKPSILRLLGSAEWDIEKAWTAQQDKYEAGKTIFGDTHAEKPDEGSEDDEEEDEDYYDDDGENMFMVAPTTFFESADILLVIFSFSASRDFFSASAVNRRWSHVGRKMRESRDLVQNFSKGLVRSLTMQGVVPIAIASAGTSTRWLKKFHRQTMDELADPDYNGRNGGALVPLYDLQGETLYGSDHAYKTGAKILDHQGIITSRTKSYYYAEPEQFTLCISIGRLPTPTSAGVVNLPHNGCCAMRQEKEEDGGWKRMSPYHRTEHTTMTRLEYPHKDGCEMTMMALPVIYVRCFAAHGDAMRNRLLKAVTSNWKSEMGGSISVDLQYPAVVDGGDIVEERQGGPADELRAKAEGVFTIVSLKDEQQRDRENQARWSAEMYQREKQQEIAREVAPLWEEFVWYLPPPKFLWRSFADNLKTKAGSSKQPDELWFQPPMSAAWYQKSKKEKSRLTHDDIVETLKLASPARLLGVEMTVTQQKILSHLTSKFAVKKGDL